MSTPAGRPVIRPNFLDYAPKRVRESMDPRRDEGPRDPIPIAPRRPAPPDEPEDGIEPDVEERNDIPLVPDDPQDQAAHRHASRDEAAYDEAPYEEAPYEEGPYDDEAEAVRGRDEAPYVDAPYDDDARLAELEEQLAQMHPQHGESHRDTELDKTEDQLAELVTMLKSIRRGNDAAAPPAPTRRAGTLPPFGSVLESDLVIDGLRVPPSLRPSHVPPPPRPRGAGPIRIMLGVVLACVVAAGLAWFVAGNWRASVLPTAAQAADEHARDSAAAGQPDVPTVDRGPRLASAAASYTFASARPAAETPPAAAEQPPAVPAPGPRAVRLVRVPAWPGDTQGGALQPPAAPSLASLPPAAAPQPSLPSDPPAPPPEPAMNAQQIDLLLNQGKQFIAVGDLATARTVLQRAADAGVAAAALALAETYDPAVLAQQGVRGLNGDVTQARRWYARAQELGSAEAARRLATMAQP